MLENLSLMQHLIECENGLYELRDKDFLGDSFSNFFLGQDEKYKSINVENVRFMDCEVLSDGILLQKSVSLKNVLFSNLRVERLTFDSSCRFDNVTLEGGKGSTLWLNLPRKDDHTYDKGVVLAHPEHPNGICLDVSKYLGDLTIKNVKPVNIKLNEETQYHCHLDNLNAIEHLINPANGIFNALKWLCKSSSTGYFIGSTIAKNGRPDPKKEKAIEELRELGGIL